VSKKGLRLAAVAVALAGMAGPAAAICPICNSSVRLDAALAACFAYRAGAEEQRFKDEDKGFVIVDLSDCPSPRQTLPTNPRAATASASLDTSFVADGTTLKCLAAAIADYQGPMDPSVLFDLAEICK
jgi:hypothetical protein